MHKIMHHFNVGFDAGDNILTEFVHPNLLNLGLWLSLKMYDEW